MKKSNHVILGVHITDRVKRAEKVQHVFTRYGCAIKTRLGLHEAGEDCCSPSGLILLEVVAPAADLAAMQKTLKAIPGVDVKKMVFPHPVDIAVAESHI